ncbi:type II secretion system F family protein [Massilia sp. SYSU DXS3249]
MPKICLSLAQERVKAGPSFNVQATSTKIGFAVVAPFRYESLLQMAASQQRSSAVHFDATRRIQTEVSTGTSLTMAMQNAAVFPSLVTQMVAIGEESGALDAMLGKVADFFEDEVDEAVAALSSLMEPMIMFILGVLIGGLVVAMYLPIFKLGSVV